MSSLKRGRNWKVVTPEGFLVPLQEDVFAQLVLNHGIGMRGRVPVPLQWCQSSSALRLEIVGSEEHQRYNPRDMSSVDPLELQLPACELQKGSWYRVGFLGNSIYAGRFQKKGYGSSYYYVWIDIPSSIKTAEEVSVWLVSLCETPETALVIVTERPRARGALGYSTMLPLDPFLEKGVWKNGNRIPMDREDFIPCI